MHTSEALLDIHERAHRNVAASIAHCRELAAADLQREVAGFGSATVQLQIHHGLGAERYWIGVLEGRIDVREDEADYPDVDSLERFRAEVFAGTQAYLRAASAEELNTPRAMTTWGENERVLVPAQVVLRTVLHLAHHQGQIAAMCRILGKPSGGWDYPIE